MGSGELFGELIKVFGGAGVSAGIMYLWIKHLIKENSSLKKELKESQDCRVEELKNVLPLLTSASEGLQEVISDNKDRDNTLITTIISHIDSTVKNLLTKCKSKTDG